MVFAVERILVSIQRVLVTILLMVTFVLVAIQVAVRYFRLPLPDTSEVSLVAVAMLAFICIGLLVYTGGHISIEVVSLLPSKKLQFILRQVAGVGVLVFVVVYGAQAWRLFQFSLSSGESTLALRFPLAVPFACLVVGVVLAGFHTVMNAIRDVKTLLTPDAEFVYQEEVEE